MARFIYKVGPQCSGKTSWLCDRAHEGSTNNQNLFYYTSKSKITHYNSFTEKYFYKFGAKCKLTAITSFDELSPEERVNSVILIDNFMEYVDGVEFLQLVKSCSENENITVYITINGDNAEAVTAIEQVPEATEWEQLSLFDN